LSVNLPFHHLADLHHAALAAVLALVGDELLGGGSESVDQFLHGAEEEVSDGVIGRRSARRKAANAFVDLDANESA
jgi:hypothetical protein